jgi:nucleoside-diphosphate-sugar epimerase
MRNDHIAIHLDDKKPHRFVGTLNTSNAGGIVTPAPSDSIKIINSAEKPKTFAKQVKEADYIVLDISQFNINTDEAEAVIAALKTQAAKKQTLIVISTPMVWSNTVPKPDSTPYSDSQFDRRVPLPRYQQLKFIEMNALALSKCNTNIRVHIICSGFLYGNGEQNDIFYEFFRSAWVSLHPELAALPVVSGGCNHLPTIHVKDLTNCIELVLINPATFESCLIAVDDSADQT